jgi:Flp pilus assembly protein TadG
MKYQGTTKILPADPEGGAVAVEFIILFPLLLMILAGIFEIGNLFYVRHTLTNASREGARAAVVYHVGSDRATWAQTTAKSTVDKYLLDTKFTRAYTVATTAGNGTGQLVTVNITAPKVPLVLGQLIPAFQNLSVSAETTMKME